jgi:hypothetical protein
MMMVKRIDVVVVAAAAAVVVVVAAAAAVVTMTIVRMITIIVITIMEIEGFRRLLRKASRKATMAAVEFGGDHGRRRTDAERRTCGGDGSSVLGRRLSEGGRRLSRVWASDHQAPSSFSRPLCSPLPPNSPSSPHLCHSLCPASLPPPSTHSRSLLSRSFHPLVRQTHPPFLPVSSSLPGLASGRWQRAKMWLGSWNAWGVLIAQVRHNS